MEKNEFSVEFSHLERAKQKEEIKADLLDQIKLVKKISFLESSADRIESLSETMIHLIRLYLDM